MTETQHQTITIPTLADALAAANVNENDSQEKRPVKGEKPVAVGNGGVPTPPGRPKGVRNKLTNLRDAVIEAFDRVGGVDYLVKMANGTQSDRAAFTSLMNKVLPTQINQQVEGGIRLELGWLGGRGVGATAAQIPEGRTQVLDLERDSDGGYRIKDQAISPEGGDGVLDAEQKGPEGRPLSGTGQGAGDAQGA
jgi:hypothetical protein